MNKGGNAMPSKYLTRQQYFNFVVAVALLNNCRIMDINFSERIIKIEGHPKSVYACSAELFELMGQ